MSDKPHLSFNKPDDETGAGRDTRILRTWHKDLEDDRGGRADLRRKRSTLDVAFSPAFHRLRRDLEGAGFNVHRDGLARVAALAAHVTEDAPKHPVAAQMGRPRSEGGGAAAVSELRFRQLLSQTLDTPEDEEQFLAQMLRTVQLLGGAVNLRDLAHGVYWWHQDRTRRDWAYAYYGEAPAPSSKS